MMSRTTKGIYLSLAAAVISGVSIFVNKFAVDAIKPALFFTSTKNIAVGLLIFCTLATRNKFHLIKKLSRRELLYLAIVALIGGAIPFYLFFTGLSRVSAINANILQKTLVFWVAILALPFLNERLSRKQLLGVSLLFLSNFIIGGFRGFNYSTGEFFILAATLLWAIEAVLVKKIIANVDADIVTFFRMGIGSIILFAASLLTIPNVLAKATALNTTQTFWLMLTILSLYFYVSTWYRALKLMPATSVTALLVGATLVTNFLSAIFITHSWNVLATIQTLFIVLGILIMTSTKAKDPKILSA